MVECLGCGVVQRHLGRHLGKMVDCQRMYYLSFPAFCDEADEGEMGGAEVEVTALWQAHYQRQLTQQVFEGLAEMTWIRYVPASAIKTMIKYVRKWIEFVLKQIEPDLSTMIGPDMCERVLQFLRERFDLFRNLDTFSRLERYAFAHMPVLPLVELKVGPGAKDNAYVTIVVKWVESVMKTNKDARIHMVEQSEIYKSGKLRDRSETISKWSEGTAFKAHPFSKCLKDEPGGCSHAAQLSVLFDFARLPLHLARR